MASYDTRLLRGGTKYSAKPYDTRLLGGTPATTPNRASTVKPSAAHKATMPLGPAQLAARDAAASVAAQKAQLEALRQQKLAMYSGNNQAITGFTKALAEILQGIAPQVGAAYGGAAKDQAAFAQGFADEQTRQLNASAAHANDVLAAVNAPRGQQLGSGATTAAANVLYGLGGKIPADTLSSQGAAFQSAAAFAPLAAQGQGQNFLAQNLSNQNAALAALDAQGASISAEQRNSYLNRLGYYQTSQANQRANAATLAEKQREFNVGAQLAGYKAQSANATTLAGLKERVAHDRAIEQNQALNRQQRSQATADRLATQRYIAQLNVATRRATASKPKTKADTTLFGSSPHKNQDGVWVTRKGKRLSPSGQRYWDGLLKRGLTDGAGHVTKPSKKQAAGGTADSSTPPWAK